MKNPRKTFIGGLVIGLIFGAMNGAMIGMIVYGHIILMALK